MSVNIVLMDESGRWKPHDVYAEAGTETFEMITRPYTASQVQVFGVYYHNAGTETLHNAFMRTRLTTYNWPGVANYTVWRDNAQRHILPRIQFTGDSVSIVPPYMPMGVPLGLGYGPPYGHAPYIDWQNGFGGSIPPGPSLFVAIGKYTSVVTDTRTASPYNYSQGANPLDHPYAFALEITGTVGGRRFAQIIGQ